MQTTSPNAAQTVCIRSTLFGEFVEIEFPFAFLEPEEAEQLAQRLIVAAYLVRERRTQPTTRPLPFCEPFSLEPVSTPSPRPHLAANAAGRQS